MHPTLCVNCAVLLLISAMPGCTRRNREHDEPPATSSWDQCVMGECPFPRLAYAMARCGWVTVDAKFVGHYQLDEERSFPKEDDQPDATAEQRAAAEEFRALSAERFVDLVVDTDRIRSGKSPVQEFCFVEVRTETDRVFDAAALWHEDVGDPGDASIVYVRFERSGDEARFNMYGEAKERKKSHLFYRIAGR
jgi:hypothetical protein